MKTISQLKTYEIKFLKRYCEKILYSFKLPQTNDEIKIFTQIVFDCEKEICIRCNHVKN